MITRLEYRGLGRRYLPVAADYPLHHEARTGVTPPAGPTVRLTQFTLKG